MKCRESCYVSSQSHYRETPHWIFTIPVCFKTVLHHCTSYWQSLNYTFFFTNTTVLTLKMALLKISCIFVHLKNIRDFQTSSCPCIILLEINRKYQILIENIISRQRMSKLMCKKVFYLTNVLKWIWLDYVSTGERMSHIHQDTEQWGNFTNWIDKKYMFLLLFFLNLPI